MGEGVWTLSFVCPTTGKSLKNALSATITKPISDLLKKDVQSSWGPMQKKSLDEVKQTLVNATILAFQNPQKPITISSVTRTHEIYSWWVACKVL